MRRFVTVALLAAALVIAGCGQRTVRTIRSVTIFLVHSGVWWPSRWPHVKTFSRLARDGPDVCV